METMLLMVIGFIVFTYVSLLIGFSFIEMWLHPYYIHWTFLSLIGGLLIYGWGGFITIPVAFFVFIADYFMYYKWGECMLPDCIYAYNTNKEKEK